MIEQKTKVCSKKSKWGCGKKKPIIDEKGITTFSKNKRTPDGYNYMCKKCMRKYMKIYHKARRVMKIPEIKTEQIAEIPELEAPQPAKTKKTIQPFIFTNGYTLILEIKRFGLSLSLTHGREDGGQIIIPPERFEEMLQWQEQAKAIHLG